MSSGADRDEAFLRESLALAESSVRESSGGPFGAVIAHGDRVVARGWNQVTASLDPTAHAEVVAIRAACRELGRFDLGGCRLYASCEPCPMCYAAAHWARVDAIVYAASRQDAAAAGFDDELLHREIALPLGARRLAMRQALQGEAQAAFALWRAAPGRVPY